MSEEIGNSRIGLRNRRITSATRDPAFSEQMRRLRHSSLQEQANHLNQMLADTMRTTAWPTTSEPCARSIVLLSLLATVLSSRSWNGTVYWKKFQQIKEQFGFRSGVQEFSPATKKPQPLVNRPSNRPTRLDKSPVFQLRSNVGIYQHFQVVQSSPSAVLKGSWGIFSSHFP